MRILSPAKGRPSRRILYVNSYGMGWAWPLVQSGLYPGSHLWGCPELVRLGYEVALPFPDSGDEQSSKFAGDRKLVALAHDWLGQDGILYCAFNVLRWTALARRVQYLRCPVVGLLYGRGDDLPFSRAYSGVIGMTPAGLEQAKRLAPKAKTAHLGWGLDLAFYPLLEFQEGGFLSCGQTRRDHVTLNQAVSQTGARLKLISKTLSAGLSWPSSTEMIQDEGGPLGLSYGDLIHTHYAAASAALVILRPDAEERFACGFTNVIEALALGRPVIASRTGALVREIDIEKEGCGLFVPPDDPQALALAMHRLSADPAMAASMGLAGRRLCERRYDIALYGRRLHEFFETL